MRGNGVIGIRREDKNNWERRAPLTPACVSRLVSEGIKVLIQPSNIRVFPNAEYAEAGAVLTEDLTLASTVLAVKEVPVPLLLPSRTYMFFSHTIKAQPSNMPLLDALLERRIRMIDYECITENGLRGARRLVAFGRYAGIAGAVDFFRGLGARLLALGYSTPFLGVGPTFSYPTLEAAFNAVAVCGSAIRRYGLPLDVSPLTAVVTGSGNVSRGAQEVLDALGCIKRVTPFELQGVVAHSTGKDRTHTVYLAVATEEHMVRRRLTALALPASSPGRLLDGSGSVSPHSPMSPKAAWDTSLGMGSGVPFDEAFDKAAYKATPDEYEPIFHSKVAPFASVIVNCMYWEQRFPRLLTVAQARALQRTGNLRLLGVCDISCDFQGSIEFLKEFTSIERPFYVYNPAKDSVVHDDMAAPGILYHAVDHLPSECPRDASEHFSACLMPFIPAIARSDGSLAFADQHDLPLEIRGAVLCAGGALTPNFEHISTLRAAAVRAATARSLRASRKESFVTVDLVGHLFDSGIINRILDLIEDKQASARILDFKVGKDRHTPTEMRLQVFSPHGGSGSSSTGTTQAPPRTLESLLSDIRTMASGMGVALSIDAEDSFIHHAAAERALLLAPPKPALLPPKRVLVIGAGMVSPPLVELLLRRPATFLSVASMFPGEAEALAKGNPRITPLLLDVMKDDARLDALVAAHDIVVSLVPAPAHPTIARKAIAHRKHMVTASYIGPDLMALSAEAEAAGIIILCEAGLDPGIDHMSARRMIDGIHERGGVVTSFSSVCGGLPAPEAANNPLGYKFSWSPWGALAAARNSARYVRDGHTVDVPGGSLLCSAAPLHVNPAYALEVLPNRDSTAYADMYGIAGPALAHMFRGTLRYTGFCRLLHALVALGMLDTEKVAVPAGVPLRGLLAMGATGGDATAASLNDDALFDLVVERVAKAAVKAEAALRAALPPTTTGGGLEGLSPSNATLRSNAAHREELRDFLTWLDLFSLTTPAPLRVGSTAAVATTSASSTSAAPAIVTAADATVTVSHVPLDTLVALLTSKPEMSFAAGERDMALMRHEVRASFPDGTEEAHSATLIEYADLVKGHTAMAHTVGYTAALAALLILDGGVEGVSGVQRPITRRFYGPLLAGLEAEGIAMAESVKVTRKPSKATAT